jgi:RHS repeat-associated protein
MKLSMTSYRPHLCTARYPVGTDADQRFARRDAIPNVAGSFTDTSDRDCQLVETGGTIDDGVSCTDFRPPTDSNAKAEYRLSFTGQEWDEEAGQQSCRVRYFGPDVRSFRREEPLGFAAGDTNLYRYVKNEPATFVDPSGNAPARPPSNSFRIQQLTELIRKLNKEIADLKNVIAGMVNNMGPAGQQRAANLQSLFDELHRLDRERQSFHQLLNDLAAVGKCTIDPRVLVLLHALVDLAYRDRIRDVMDQIDFELRRQGLPVPDFNALVQLRLKLQELRKLRLQLWTAEEELRRLAPDR